MFILFLFSQTSFAGAHNTYGINEFDDAKYREYKVDMNRDGEDSCQSIDKIMEDWKNTVNGRSFE